MQVTEKSAWIEALTVSKADFSSGKYGRLYSWSDVPTYWFMWATDANLLDWEKGEKLKRVAAAKIEAQSERVINVESRAIIIQRKRAVWDKLVNK